ASRFPTARTPGSPRKTCRRSRRTRSWNNCELVRMDAASPPDPKALLAQAQVYLRRAEHDRAVATLTHAIEVGPTEADLYFLRGNAHAATGAFAAAVEDFSAAADLRPEFAAAYHNRGMAHADLGRDDEAVA